MNPSVSFLISSQHANNTPPLLNTDSKLKKISQTVQDVALKILKAIVFPFHVLASLVGRFFCCLKTKSQNTPQPTAIPQIRPQAAERTFEGIRRNMSWDMPISPSTDMLSHLVIVPYRPQAAARTCGGIRLNTPIANFRLAEQLLIEALRRNFVQDPYFRAGLELPSERARFIPTELALVPYRPHLEETLDPIGSLTRDSTHSSFASSLVDVVGFLDDREEEGFPEGDFRYTWQMIGDSWQRFRRYEDGLDILDNPVVIQRPIEQAAQRPLQQEPVALPRLAPLAEERVVDEAFLRQQEEEAARAHEAALAILQHAEQQLILRAAVNPADHHPVAQEILLPVMAPQLEERPVAQLQPQGTLDLIRRRLPNLSMNAIQAQVSQLFGKFANFALGLLGHSRGLFTQLMSLARNNDPLVRELSTLLFEISKLPQDARDIKAQIAWINLLSMMKVHHIALIPSVAKVINNMTTAPMRAVYDHYLEPHVLSMNSDQIAPLFRFLAAYTPSDDQRLIAAETALGLEWLGAQARAIEDAAPGTLDAASRDARIFEGLNPLTAPTAKYKVLEELGLTSSQKIQKTAIAAQVVTKGLQLAVQQFIGGAPAISVIKRASLLESHNTLIHTTSKKVLRPAFASISTMLLALAFKALFSSQDNFIGEVASSGVSKYVINQASGVAYSIVSATSRVACHTLTGQIFSQSNEDLTSCQQLGMRIDASYTQATKTIESYSTYANLAIGLLWLSVIYSALKPSRTASLLRSLRLAFAAPQAAPAEER